MKILVVSDNHGDRDCLVDLVNHYEGQVDALFHCGDSELEPTDELWQKLIVVQGNCDFYDEFPKTVTKKVGDQVIYMTHGHLANVRMGLTTLALQAEEAGATIALFGHTHVLGAERHNNVSLNFSENSSFQFGGDLSGRQQHQGKLPKSTKLSQQYQTTDNYEETTRTGELDSVDILV